MTGSFFGGAAIDKTSYVSSKDSTSPYGEVVGEVMKRWHK